MDDQQINAIAQMAFEESRPIGGTFWSELTREGELRYIAFTESVVSLLEKPKDPSHD